MSSRLNLQVGRLFARPSSRIMVGLAIGQAAIYGVTPILSRLYSPSQMGHAGAFLAWASIIGAIAGLKFEMLLVGSDEATGVWALRQAGRNIGLASVFAAVAYTIASGPVQGVAFALATAGLASTALLVQFAARQKELDGVARSKAAQGLTQAGAQTGLGYAGAGSTGMQIGYATGYAVSAAVQWQSIRRSLHALPRRRPSRDVTKPLWRRSLVLALSAVFNLGTVWAQLLLIGYLYGPGPAGHFTIAQRLAIAPAGLVVAALTPPLLSRVGERLRDGESPWQSVVQHLVRSLPVAIAAGLVFLLVPATLVTAVLGPGWAPVKTHLDALLPLTLSLLVVGATSQVLGVLGAARQQLLWDITRAAAMFGVGIATYASGATAGVTILATSATFAIFYVIYVAVLRNACKTRYPSKAFA